MVVSSCYTLPLLSSGLYSRWVVNMLSMRYSSLLQLQDVLRPLERRCRWQIRLCISNLLTFVGLS